MLICKQIRRGARGQRVAITTLLAEEAGKGGGRGREEQEEAVHGGGDAAGESERPRNGTT